MHLRQEADISLAMRLADNPCRGIVIGLSEAGESRHFSWIMGRSANSQNRVYVKDRRGIDVCTAPADPSKVEDPLLIIYNAMRHVFPFHVVSNGDQTDSVAFELEDYKKGVHHKSPALAFMHVLNHRFCEPDAPIFTPRISGYSENGRDVAYFSLLRPDYLAKAHWIETEKASGLKKDDFRKPGLNESEVTDAYNRAIGERAGLDHLQFPTVRSYFELPLKPGFGFCLTTYKPGSKTLDSFDGEPFLVPVVGNLEESAMVLWNALGEGWRVSIAGKNVPKDGNYTVFVHNTRESA